MALKQRNLSEDPAGASFQAVGLEPFRGMTTPPVPMLHQQNGSQYFNPGFSPMTMPLGQYPQYPQRIGSPAPVQYQQYQQYPQGPERFGSPAPVHHAPVTGYYPAPQSHVMAQQVGGPLKLVVGIDFGTTYSGAAFADASGGPSPYIRLIQRWPNCGTRATSQVPTELAYEPAEDGVGIKDFGGGARPFTWGLDIPTARERLKWFKLALEHPDDVIRRQYPLPAGVTILDVVTDFLTAVHIHTMEQIGLELPLRALQGATVEYVVTVPAVWNEVAMRRTEEAARRAGLAEGTRVPGGLISAGLKVMPEPEAAALYMLRNQHLSPAQTQLAVGETLVVCDAGGGTVDVVTYNIVSLYPLQVQEAAVGTGDLCGSTFIDQNFSALFEARMGADYATLKQSQIQAVVRNFEVAKCSFSDASHRPSFHINVPGKDDIPAAGVYGGEFEISREEMRQLFEPVIRKTIELIEGQVVQVESERGNGSVHVVLLVGGFGESPYLYQQVREWASPRNIVVLQPAGGSTAVVKGAVLRGVEAACPPPLPGSGIPSNLTSVLRKARKNYGIIISTPFIDGVHAQADAFIDKLSGRKLAGGQVKWFVRKGQTISDDIRLTHRFHRSFKRDAPRTWIDTLVTSTADIPPQSLGPQTTLLCRLSANLGLLPKHMFIKKRRCFRRFYKVNYEVGMAIGGGGLRFELMYQGVTYGAVAADYMTEL